MIRQWTIVGLALSMLFVANGGARQQQPPDQDQDAQTATNSAGGDVTEDVLLVPGETLENSDQQTPIFRSGINYVRVDATVTDQEGNPVLDLAADDFEIYEDGELVTTIDRESRRKSAGPELAKKLTINQPYLLGLFSHIVQFSPTVM